MMKRFRSYGDDMVLAAGEKDVDRTASISSSHHRRFYPKGSENGRRRPSPAIDDDRDRMNLRKRGDHHDLEGFDDIREGSSSRVLRKRGDRDFSEGFDDRDVGGKGFRKRFDHESDGFDRRRGFGFGFGIDRNRDRDAGKSKSSTSLVSPRGGGYGVERERERDRERDRDRERIHRSESFCMSRRVFPKGFRSERHWSRREDGGVSSSWRRFNGRSNKKDVVDDDVRNSPIERGGSCSSKGGGGSSRDSLRSPRGGIKDVKSPTWSKDSTKDSKDSVGGPLRDMKRNESSMVVESAGSEMEEGEVHPDSVQVPTSIPQKQVVENVVYHANNAQVDKGKVKSGNSSYEVKPCQTAESKVDTRKLSPEDEKKEAASKDVSGDGKQPDAIDTAENEDVKGTQKLSTGGNDNDDAETNDGRSSKENQPEICAPTSSKVEEGEQTSVNRPSPEKETLNNGFDLEAGFNESNKSLPESRTEPEPCVSSAIKDKGKSVAVCCSPDEVVSPKENNLLIERNFITCPDDAMEGPSTRGFELFSSSAGIKMESASTAGVNQTETERLKLEPLDLSLSLPNVSVAAASHSAAAAAPNSPPHARSVQSFGTTFRTGSDCFTNSISFSGSQFVHNPSCSLTHNSVDCDFEQSVKSRPLFQGVDWQALNVNDPMPNEILAKQKSLLNSNGSIQPSHASQGTLNVQSMQGQQDNPTGMANLANFQRQFFGKVSYRDDLRSPAQSTGSLDTRSEYGKDRNLVVGEESVSRLFRSSSQRVMEQRPVGERERDLVERIIYAIVSEPVQSMAWRVRELPERSVAYLKESTADILVKEEHKGRLCALKEVLRKRTDLTSESLLKSHRVQLQILVAIKTGLTDFVQCADSNISLNENDLAEIFLGLKCRNSNCRSALPVDECECRFCSQKDGFCNSCMCLVCSKFDTASDTCGWVGCDVCNHWCHTDCGLLKSYIRNGQSASGTHGLSEMQFYCLACDHPSEMFGFVKDVFQSCAAEWKAETLVKELEYVKRIFSASNDTRGKFLHDVAKQLLARLRSGANADEVCCQISSFLNESDSKFSNALQSSSRELQPGDKNRRGVGDGVVALCQEAIWSKTSAPKEISGVENVGVSLPIMDGNSAGGNSWNNDILGMRRTPVVDELDSIIKIKQAEAQMFQKRADDARREAEGLKRIAMAKAEKIEEEYANRIAKLQLSDVEERRRQKLEELQMLERSHREYFNMKTRMEADIKDLLRKMEATRQNLST